MSLSSSPPNPLLSLQPSLPPTLSTISPPPLRAANSLLPRRAVLSLLAISPVHLSLPQPVYAVENTLFDDPEREEDRVVRLFRDASPSVVFIKDLEILSSSGKAGSNLEQREEDEEWGSVKVEGTGSGFVWDEAGHIVTNYHVIAKLASDNSGKRRCKVYLEDANGNTSSKEGKLIGTDPSYDLAVLKVDVDRDKLKPAPIGSSNDLRVGQNCYAIGNPYGYEHTLTTGVVSGLGRQIPSPNGRPIRGAIQTDAAINAGNSGGPLIDSHGHVIGVNTSTFTRKGTGISSGVNFAIPIDSVVQTVPYLIVYGRAVSNRF